MASFALAVLVGGFAGNPMPVVLWRALVVMGVCWMVGALVGHVAQRLVDAEVDAYRRSNPIPPLSVEQHPGDAAPESASADAG